MKNWWIKTELLRERFTPLILGALAAAIFYWQGKSWVPQEKPGELFTAAISIAAITVGFLANMKAILFSIERKRIIEQLRGIDYYRYVIGYLMVAIRASFVLAIVSGFALTLDYKQSYWWMHLAAALWVGLLVHAICAYYRVLAIFSSILRSAD